MQRFYHFLISTATVIVALIVLSSSQSTAQGVLHTDSIPDLFSMMRTPLSQLDTNAMLTGLLAEGTLPMSDLSRYQGTTVPHDSLAVDEGLYQNQYITAFGMAMTQARTAELLTEAHMSHADHAIDTAHLHGMALAYNRFSPTAFDNQLLAYDSVQQVVYDVPGRTSSPYLGDTLVTVALAGGRRDTLDVQMLFQREDLLGGLATGRQFWIDAGQGFIKHDFGELFTLTFADYDKYVLTVRLATTSGWRYAKVQLTLKQDQYRMTGEPFDKKVPYYGGDGSRLGSYYIKFNGTCEDQLTRPLIIVNGFDPTGEGALRLPRLQEEFKNFVFSGQHRFSNLELGEVLFSEEYFGYDLIFITFKDGKASNITTAKWLMEAIASINARKAADGVDADTPIIGVSMGGITTKIAISMMEDADIDHGLSKFFSFDTPFQGANIPIGMQHLISHFYHGKVNGVLIRKFNADIRNNGRSLFNHAASEMLLLRAEARVRYRTFLLPTTIEHFTTNTAHTNFMSYFNGITIDVPHYAIANGAASGTISDVGAGTSPQHNNNSELMRVEKFFVLLNFKAKAYNASGTVFRIEVFQPYPPYYRNFPYPFTPAINFDLEPGGTRGMHDPDAFGNNPEKIENGTRFFVDYHSFVPTWSALNNPPGGSRTTGGSGVDFVYSGREQLTSRHDAAAQSGHQVFNHAHVTVTPGIANFLVEHLDPGPSISTVLISNNTLASEYNFGSAINTLNGPISTPKILFGEHIVTSAGKLLVNANTRIGDVDDPSNPVNDDLDFNLTLTDGPCNSPLADITLQSGAEFLIGQTFDRTATVTALPGTRVTVQQGGVLSVDNGSLFNLASNGPDGQGGIIVEAGGLINAAGPFWTANAGGRIIADGGTIRVKSGGMLRTSYSGQIIARNGGKVILEPGALVQLWSSGADEGEGTLHIDAGGELVIEGTYDFTGEGYFQFSKGNRVSGEGTLRITGEHDEHRRMQLNEGAIVELTDQDFFVRGARIVYHRRSQVYLHQNAEVDARDVDFDGPAYSALHTDGSGKFNVRNSDFINNRTGVNYFPTSNLPGANFILRASTFKNCGYGLLVDAPAGIAAVGPHPSVSQSTFTECETGVHIENYPSCSIRKCSFTSRINDAYAVVAFDVGNVLLNSNNVFGYNTEKKGAVLLDEVGYCDVIGGSYVSNVNAFKIDQTVSARFRGCVDLTDNSTGIFVSKYADATIELAAINLNANSIGIKGGNINLTSTATNTFVKGTGRLFDFINTGANPLLLNGNSWGGGQLIGGLPSPLSYDQWFCLNNTCQGRVDITTAGTGCADCDSPKTCPEYCILYPNAPECEFERKNVKFKDSASLEVLRVFPNPSIELLTITGGVSGAGTLHLLDLTGRLILKQSYADGSHLKLNTELLVSGTYVLQLHANSGSSNPQVARFVRQ